MNLNSSARPVLIATLLAGVTIGVVFATAWSVFADGDPTTDTVPRMIPYQGQLELNGEPVHAQGDDAIWIEFALYDGPGADTPVYAQRMPVEVYSGRFTTTIGPTGEQGEAISDVIQAADDLHLGLTILNDPEDDGDDVTMTNRQRIMATPYAMWTTSATNLTVASALTVGGAAEFQGEVTAARDVRVGASGRLRLQNTADASNSDDGALVIGDAARNITLDNNELIARANGAASDFFINSPTTVSSDLTVSGNLYTRPTLRRPSHTFTTSGTNSINCNANEVPISCGTEKTNNGAGDEDSLGCFVDLANNRCRVWLDVASEQDGDQRGYCVCLRVQP